MVANPEKEHLSMAICDGNSLQHGDEDESTATDVHTDICERLTAVEAALRLQLAAGTSHLQEIEMAPGAFGLSAAARPAIKAIRKRRNAALHVVGPGQVAKLPSQVQDFDAERAKDTHGKTVHEHEVIATGKEMLKSYGGGVGRGAVAKLVSEWDGKTVHEVIATGKAKLKSYGGGFGRGAAEKKEEKKFFPRGHLGRGKGIDDGAFVQSLLQTADAFAASW